MKTKTMLKSIIAAAVVSFTTIGFGQVMDVELNHHFNGEAFSYDTDYTLGGKKVSFTRVQYYLGNFDITHDGGLVHTPSDSWVLASGNVTDYSFDVGVPISDIESVEFNFGVDESTNGMGTSFWSADHPLATQTPNMDWGWPSGYKFFAFEGMVDSDDDGTPDKLFQLHGIGNDLLQDVMVTEMAGGNLVMYVNVAAWLKGVDLVASGIQHNGDVVNQGVADATSPNNVFTGVDVAGVSNNPLEESKLYVDYTMEYAPTIYYDLLTNDQVEVVVTDMSGKQVLSASNLNPEGNFFVRAELETGTYIATFFNAGLKESIRFVVNN